MSTWTIVLAQGTGEQALAETLARAQAFAPDERTWLMTHRAHQDEAARALAATFGVRHVEQAFDRGTTPAITIATLAILRQDPLARVVVLPAGQHVADDLSFALTVLDALASLDEDPNAALLLGADPPPEATGHAWILPIFRAGDRWPHVLDLRPPPTGAPTTLLRRSGGLLDTRILVAEAWTVADLVRTWAPAWFRALCRAEDSVAAEAAYWALPPSSFADEVLAPARDSLRMVPLGDVGWAEAAVPPPAARSPRATPLRA